MIIEITDREACALYNLIALGEIDVDRELDELEKSLEFHILRSNAKKNKFPALGRDTLCAGYTELARANSAGGN